MCPNAHMYSCSLCISVFHVQVRHMIMQMFFDMLKIILCVCILSKADFWGFIRGPLLNPPSFEPRLPFKPSPIIPNRSPSTPLPPFRTLLPFTFTFNFFPVCTAFPVVCAAFAAVFAAVFHFCAAAVAAFVASLADPLCFFRFAAVWCSLCCFPCCLSCFCCRFWVADR